MKNGLSNDKTEASSISSLKAVGLEEFAKNNTDTGVLYFIDARTKKLISKISLASSNEEIEQKIKDAISKV
ncbi:MAG: hypothetical protein ACTHK8_12285 [Ginsengibacter sp.]